MSNISINCLTERNNSNIILINLIPLNYFDEDYQKDEYDLKFEKLTDFSTIVKEQNFDKSGLKLGYSLIANGYSLKRKDNDYLENTFNSKAGLFVIKNKEIVLSKLKESVIQLYYKINSSSRKHMKNNFILESECLKRFPNFERNEKIILKVFDTVFDGTNGFFKYFKSEE